MTARDDLISVIDIYFEGLYHADIKMLADVFHKEARYVNAVEGDYVNYTLQEYFDIVECRIPPAKEGNKRTDRIIGIDFSETHMAFAKLSMSMMNREYLDYLTLIFQGEKWRIISKVFTYTKN